jgi:hypothetical protein
VPYLVAYVADMTVAVSGQTLLLRDGRRLGYAEYGRSDGEPGFYFQERHLAAQIPNCHATFFSEDGHLLFAHMSEIVRAFAI